MLYLKRGTASINYMVTKSHRAKYLKIQLDEQGLRVVAPVSMNDRQISRFLNDNKDLVFEKYEKICDQQAQSNKKLELNSGDHVLYLGKNISVRVNEHEKRSTLVKLSDECFLITLNKNMPTEMRKEEIRRTLEKWYRCRARELILNRLNFFSQKIGVQFNSVRLKNQRTRWGSCSQKRNLNFNWKLIMAPSDIIDYVIVHELCHLHHMNHSKDFWQLVSKYMPDYLKKRKWLREYGSQLSLNTLNKG